MSSPVRDGTSKLTQHRWTLIPDSEGKMHLVDFDSYDVAIEPNFVAENDVVFILFTRSNPTSGQIIRINDPSSLTNSNFNPSHPTRFTVHGWQSDANTGSNTLLHEAFLRYGDFNVSLRLNINYSIYWILFIHDLKDDHSWLEPRCIIN